MKQSVDVRLDEISIDLPPDLEVNRDEYVWGLIEELTRLIRTQDLPAVASRETAVARLNIQPAGTRDSRTEGRQAAGAIRRGMTEWT